MFAVPSRCWCDRRALAALCAEARGWPIRETGGALLGWTSAGEIVIAVALGPGPGAKHRIRSFEPDAGWQNAQGNHIYKQSGRTIRYLGDWHSHPRSPPAPSNQDRRTAAMIAADTNFRTPSPLYAIVGRSGRLRRNWRMHLWQWRRGALHRLAIEPCDLPVPDYNR
jgi:integrative and conjugative element protein (TIGR02256 family)